MAFDGQNPGWTPERVEKLKKLWTEGLSASEIASRLGYTTRNAVIGKVHRLGLNARVQGRKTGNGRLKINSRKSVKTKPAKPKANKKSNRPGGDFNFTGKPARPATEVASMKTFSELLEAFSPIPESQPTDIVSVRANQCRWPISKSDGAEMPLCGAPVGTGPHLYCEHHTDISAGRASMTDREQERFAGYISHKDGHCQPVDREQSNG